MIKEKLTHNLGLKISSIVIAAILWLTVMNGADPMQTETFKDIPVQIVNDEVITSRGYGYSIESGESINVKVKGRRSVVDQLTDQNFTAIADFNTLNDLYMVNITVGCNAADSNELDITAMTSTMIVKRENQTSVPYTIKINQVGEVKEGYYCMDCKANATLVQVTGSVSQIEEVKEVAVLVDMGGKMNSFTNRYELIAYDKHGNPIDSKKVSFSQEYVDVTATICPTKTVEITVTTQGDPKEGYYVRKLEWAPQTVTIAADEALLKTVSDLQLTCYVGNASEDAEMQIDLNAYLGAQYGPGIVSAEGDISIGMVANIVQFTTKQIKAEGADVTLLGRSQSYDYQFLGTATVIVSGPSDIIAELSPAELRMYVDVSGLGAGTHNVEIMYEHDDSFRTITTGSAFVRITEHQMTLEEMVGSYSEQ